MTAENSARTRYVSVSLRELAELVAPPEFDPLSGQFETRSGIERMLDHLRSLDGGKIDKLRATIALGQSASPASLAQVRTALDGLCRQRDAELTEQLATTRRDGLRALGKGSMFLIACMVVAAVAREATVVPDLLRGLIAEGFVIAGWVGLWHPMELLLYEWWPIARDRKLYRLIADMEIAVEAPSDRAA